MSEASHGSGSNATTRPEAPARQAAAKEKRPQFAPTSHTTELLSTSSSAHRNNSGKLRSRSLPHNRSEALGAAVMGIPPNRGGSRLTTVRPRLRIWANLLTIVAVTLAPPPGRRPPESGDFELPLPSASLGSDLFSDRGHSELGPQRRQLPRRGSRRRTGRGGRRGVRRAPAEANGRRRGSRSTALLVWRSELGCTRAPRRARGSASASMPSPVCGRGGRVAAASRRRGRAPHPPTPSSLARQRKASEGKPTQCLIRRNRSSSTAPKSTQSGTAAAVASALSTENPRIFDGTIG